jgi:hypothetical protein
MDAAFILYFENNSGGTFCFSCAAKRAVEGEKMKLTGRDYTISGYDSRITPTCADCGEYMDDVISL